MKVVLQVVSGPSAGRRIQLRDGQTAQFGRTELADFHGMVKRLLINNVAKYVKKMVPAFDIPGASSLNQALKQGCQASGYYGYI